ncbi:MAG: PPC domain-containing DNA-binding protein [candidate division WOR-3 bacterium]
MKFKDDGNFIVLIMDDGEDFIQNIDRFIQEFKKEKIMPVVSALGMVKEIKMGFWNGKEYEIHEEKEPLELLGISGVITPSTQPPYHFHITVSTRDGKVKGGHLISSKVCNTIEMFLIKGNIDVKRKEEKGLKKLFFD